MITPGERAQSAVLSFLARDLGRAVYLQQVHVAGDRGDCAGCRSQVRWVEYPCLIRQLADECISRQIPLQRKPTP